MKQHTTKKQWWDDLNNKQRKVLIDWSRKTDNGIINGKGKLLWMQFTIGEMIEFLGDDWINGLYIIDNKIDMIERFNINNDYLCDKLWNKIKYKSNE